MKIRIKFSKHGSMKFVGHLDIMRYFQKAIKRSGIAICYSEGFSPHQIMSFAAPLGLGLTSNGEYMDIEVRDTKDSAAMVPLLNASMADGIKILSFRLLPENSKNAMSIVTAADYSLSFREGYEVVSMESLENQLSDFGSQKSILIQKKTKKSEKEIDIKPLIYKLFVKGGVIFMQLSSGSSDNLKPELVMEAFANYTGISLSPFTFCIQREELYAGGESGLISLESLGEEIER